MRFTIYDLRFTSPAGGSDRRDQGSPITDWTVEWGARVFPSPRPSPSGRGRMVHRLSIIPVPEFAQQTLAKHQRDACCSLSPRERVRVRGKSSAEHEECDWINRCRATADATFREIQLLAARGPLRRVIRNS